MVSFRIGASFLCFRLLFQYFWLVLLKAAAKYSNKNCFTTWFPSIYSTYSPYHVAKFTLPQVGSLTVGKTL